MTHRTLALAGLALAAALAAACSQQDPAQTAVAAAESALAAVSEASQKYLPKQYAEIKAELDAARTYLNDGKYLRAIDEVKDIPAKARALHAAAITAREALAAALAVDWARLQAELPGRLAALDGRLEELGKVRRPPPGLTSEALAHLSAEAGVAHRAWDESRAAHEAGDLEGAVARGLESENLAAELTAGLGMVPAPVAD